MKIISSWHKHNISNTNHSILFWNKLKMKIKTINHYKNTCFIYEVTQQWRLRLVGQYLFYHSWLHHTVIPFSTICDYMIVLYLILPFVITWYCYSLLYHLWLHDTVIPYCTIYDYMTLSFLILPFVITSYCYSLFYHSWLHDTVIPYFTIYD